MGTQIAGLTTANLLEVESATKAARTTPKPIDYGTGGIYSLGATSGVMAAGLAANAPVFSFRNSSSTLLFVLKKLMLSAGNSATTFTAGICTFQSFVARSFTASDSAGTTITLGSGNKLRTSMASSAIGDVRISATAVLTVGTRTLDTNPFGAITTSEIATPGTTILTPQPLFQAQAGDYPLVMAQNEGFVIQATVPATGTWTFSVQAQWEELTAYVP